MSGMISMERSNRKKIHNSSGSSKRQKKNMMKRMSAMIFNDRESTVHAFRR